jgi:hypothetical protein
MLAMFGIAMCCAALITVWSAVFNAGSISREQERAEAKRAAEDAASELE